MDAPCHLQVGIISSTHQLLDLRTLEVLRFLENDTTRLSLHLRDIARWVWSGGCGRRDDCTSCRESEGLSGRTLRKVPFLAHTLLSPKVHPASGCGISLVGVSSGAGRGTGGVSYCLGENCAQSEIRENEASRNGSVK